MEPIGKTAPTGEYNNNPGRGSFFTFREGSTQKPPYNLASYYRYVHIATVTASGGPSRASQYPSWQSQTVAGVKRTPMLGTDFMSFFTSERVRAVEAARSKCLAKLGSKSQVGTNLAEFRQAGSMLYKRLDTLARIAYLLSKGGREAARRTLRRRKKRLEENKNDGVSHIKGLGALWLEFHFGWDPLLQDIYSACEVLSMQPPPELVSGTGRVNIPSHMNWKGEEVTPRSRQREYLSGYAFGKVGLKVRVSNPNLLLLQRLGLVNPASIAWELVPYSFLVDWFFNVGDFLNQWSDLIGYEVIDAYRTSGCKLLAEGHRFDPALGSDPSFLGYYKKEAYGMLRYRGFPGVALRGPVFKRLSLSRALTSISLLLQHLGK